MSNQFLKHRQLLASASFIRQTNESIQTRNQWRHAVHGKKHLYFMVKQTN